MRKYAQRCAYMRAYFAHICAHSMRIYARIFNFFLADTDAYLADGYRRYARIFGMRGNPIQHTQNGTGELSLLFAVYLTLISSPIVYNVVYRISKSKANVF